jgi:hypothetical protein
MIRRTNELGANHETIERMAADRCVLTILSALLFTISAHAQDGGVEIKPQFQDAIRRKVEGFGLNCPIPYRLTWVEEDARGQVGRLDCLNREGKPWSLRYIISGKGEFFEPW